MFTIIDYWNNNKVVAKFISKDEAIDFAKGYDGACVLNPDKCMIYHNVVLPF